MKVTKCDICGAYVDKTPDEMPAIMYGSVKEDWFQSKQITPCYNCYAKFLKEFGLKEEEEKKDGQHM